MAKRIVVVGGGIIGCAVAYELARRGADVRLVEARDVGQGATQAAAGVLAPYVEAPGGGPLLALCERSLAMFDELVARAARDTATDIPYVRTGTLEVASDSASLARLEEAHARLVRLGVESRLLDGPAARELEPALSEEVAGALLVPAHGFVAAAVLTTALARGAMGQGAIVAQARAALRVAPDGGGLRVELAGERLTADAVVLAAGSWSGQVEIVGAAPLPVRPVRGQLLKLSWTGPPVGRVIWSPDCYLVPWAEGTLLVGATVEDVGFDERATVAGVRDLLEAACALAPPTWQAGFREVRTGLRPATPDGLPIIGTSPGVPGLVYAAGHYRNGILLSPLTAQLVADLLLDDRRDALLAAVDPGRFERP